MEDRRQVAILVVVVLVTLVAIGVTWWASKSSGKSGGLSASQRFTARPGTSRPNAVALTSDKRPGGVDDVELGGAPTGGEDAPDIRSLSRQDGPDARASAERLVREALEEADAEDGIQMLEDALRRGLCLEEAWRLHLALALLYGRLSPPGGERALQAYAAARAAAATAEARQRIALEEAQAFVAMGKREDAWACVETAIAQGPAGEPFSPEAAVLLVRMGDLLQETGNSSGAERAYQQALDRGLAQRGAAETLVEPLRLAATRLTLLLRGAGRHEEADALGRRLQMRFRASAAAGE
ncbi:MAG: hypothetical protein KA184_04290 [Candidatus Hydrogenedentes bacterium]|nr:hypothetical protein [Candidatus Hydrogenedentota bacterium]